MSVAAISTTMIVDRGSVRGGTLPVLDRMARLVRPGTRQDGSTFLIGAEQERLHVMRAAGLSRQMSRTILIPAVAR